MKIREAGGWLALGAGIIGILYVTGNLMKNKVSEQVNAGLLGDVGKLLIGDNPVTQGKIGEAIGSSYWSTPSNPFIRTTVSPVSGLPTNINKNEVSFWNPGGWDARYSTGYQSRSSQIFGGATVNVPATDQSFGRLGLTTAQVQQLQSRYARTDVTGIIASLRDGVPLNAKQSQQLASVGVLK